MWAKCKSCGKVSHIIKSVCNRCEWEHTWSKRIKKEEKAADKERRENPTIDAVEPFLTQRCKSCENAGRELHTCPFKSEINDDNETLCNCCDDCSHECAMDI